MRMPSAARHRADVLAARAAEADQRELARVDAARTDTSPIACAMLAFAISTKPAASAFGLQSWPAARELARAARRARRATGSRSSGKREAVGRQAAEEGVDVGERELAREARPAVAGP